MAYIAGDVSIVVQGTVGTGDNWSNSWAVEGVDLAAEQDVVDAVNQFYTDLTNTTTLGGGYSANNATLRRLSTGISVTPTWVTVFGGSAADELPGQLAVRVSLNDTQGRNGGPFISGWTTASMTSGGGKLATADQGDIIAAVTNLDTALQGLGVNLALNRTSSPELTTVVRARVGDRFDVMRSRSNDEPESYQSVTTGP